ncbi:MAG: hypothetical protein GF347_00195 [Candidatus Moranbacteria bacterium]|nr:hypothetical protein [Candidatus Moranbacteria bacterium]
MASTKKIGPIALSLSGGGAHGAWTVGALKNIWEEQHEDFRDMRIIYGTSTGALISAMMGAVAVTGDPAYFDELENIYRNTKDGDILRPAYDDDKIPWGVLKPLLDAVLGDDQVLMHAALSLLSGESSVYDTAPLEDLAMRFMPDSVWKRVIRAGSRQRKPIDVGFCITSLQTGKSMMVTNRTHKDVDVLRRAMLASACEPVLMPPVDVFGDGQQWVDGGVRDINPWKYVLEAPAFRTIRTIMALSSQSSDADPGDPEYTSLPQTLMRTLSMLISGVLQDDMDQLELLQHKSKFTKRVLHIQPSKPLVGDGLVFDPPAMRDEIRLGFRDAATYFSDKEL